MECPIRLGKIHCQNCFFWRDGKCDYDKIMKEMEHREMTHPLTQRQIQLLRYVANGKTYTEIGTALGIAPQTVMNHMTLIKLKLGAKNATHATAIALRYGLLPLSDVTDPPEPSSPGP